jgi:predicted MFS family arabinose efflux permease
MTYMAIFAVGVAVGAMLGGTFMRNTNPPVSS